MGSSYSVALQYDQATHFWTEYGISNSYSPSVYYVIGRSFFIFKTILSMFLTYKGLATQVVLKEKINEKRHCRGMTIFFKLLNSSLLIISSTGTLSYIFLSDAIMPQQIIIVLVIYLMLNIFSHCILMVMNLSTVDDQESGRIADENIILI